MEDFIAQCLKVATESYITSIKGNRSPRVRKLRHAALEVIGKR